MVWVEGVLPFDGNKFFEILFLYLTLYKEKVRETHKVTSETSFKIRR